MATETSIVKGLAALTIRGATAASLTTQCGKLLYPFVLASFAVQNKFTDGPAYSGMAPAIKSQALPWQTFDEFYGAIAKREMDRVRQRQPGHAGATKKAAPKRTHRAPVTITTRPRQMLAAVLSLFADLACAARGGNGMESIMELKDAAVVRSIIAITKSERMLEALKHSPLSSDNRMAGQVRHMLDLLVGSRSGATAPAVAVASAATAAPYIEPLTALFMNFLRCVAWQMAMGAFENGRGETPRPSTFKRETLCGALLMLGPLGAETHQLIAFMVSQAAALEQHLALSKESTSSATTAASSAAVGAGAVGAGAVASDVSDSASEDESASDSGVDE